MKKKKFYIAEIVTSVLLIGVFIFGLFMPLTYRPGTTPGDELFTSICIRVIFAISIFIMGYVIYDRSRRIKNPRYDHVFENKSK